MSTSKHTLVLGASLNPDRASWKAVQLLRAKNYTVTAFGLKAGRIADVEIQTALPEAAKLHTVTLYVNPANQVAYYDYILQLKPQRIIFNPGTENAELFQLAKDAGILPEYACTLVLLTLNDY
ncbi:MAG: CoA-binding protein [Saprospiraceae bacterium]|nr:CoA-binding protein [Saprospiraceae bacterium]